MRRRNVKHHVHRDRDVRRDNGALPNVDPVPPMPQRLRTVRTNHHPIRMWNIIPPWRGDGPVYVPYGVKDESRCIPLPPKRKSIQPHLLLLRQALLLVVVIPTRNHHPRNCNCDNYGMFPYWYRMAVKATTVTMEHNQCWNWKKWPLHLSIQSPLESYSHCHRLTVTSLQIPIMGLCS